EEVLTAGEASEGLHGRVREVRARVKTAVRESRLLIELDGIRLEKTGVKDGQFDMAKADPLYADAFRKYDLPVMELQPDEAARRIAVSAIREQLLAALVDWANVQTDLAG